MERILRRNLIERASKTRDLADTNVPYFRITSIGAYYVKRLVDRFTYIDAMVVDTPVVDIKWSKKLGQARDIKERLARAEVFLSYLDSVWPKDNIMPLGFNWQMHSLKVRYDIGYVTSKAAAKEDAIAPPPLVDKTDA